MLGVLIVPVLFVLGDRSPHVSMIVDNVLGSFISWTVQIMIFGPKLLRIQSGTAALLPSMNSLPSMEPHSTQPKVNPFPLC
jgi:hypothetical protein